MALGAVGLEESRAGLWRGGSGAGPVWVDYRQGSEEPLTRKPGPEEGPGRVVR